MKKNLAKATALLLVAGMIGGTGLTAAASDAELNPAGTYPVVQEDKAVGEQPETV